ncbi:extracellular solute-binding protein [Halogeometricum sp. S1BR25-6]|uniref:Extracellular solute-binding protein n=1 Tax=Halogeometricum salsisoli TaxID=2950536 RepID=A0ABU2GIZ9_9EURY|nr:extracellular solute-binding protein [Halogeometricum sp. S1BR25-6]MDS0300813.1 extracellular solute-binding protein [Halogeometricum sp. S1BR25-6]
MVPGTTKRAEDGSSRRSESSRLGRRRFLAAAGAAGVGGLSGCIGVAGGQGSDETVLDYWTLFGGGDGEIMASIIDKFNRERPLGEDVRINRQRTPWAEHYTRLFTSMTGGKPPDIAISHASYLRQFQDALVDISDNLDSNDYVETILDSCRIDGGQYAVPMDSHPVGLYYNVDLLREAGVEPPIDSFPKFREACNAILENTDALPFSPDPYWGGGGGFRQWFMGLNQYEGSMFNDAHTEATFGGEAGTRSLDFLASISGERGWDNADISADRVARGIRNGSIAMTVNGTWYVTVMQEQNYEWGFDKPRVFPEAQQLRSTADSHTIVVPKQPNLSDERVQLSVDAAEWITQENPSWGAQAGHLPAYNPILNSDDLRQSALWDKTLQSYAEMAEDGQLAYWPQLGNADMYATSNWTWITDAYAQNTPVDAAVRQGVEAWNAAVQ